MCNINNFHSAVWFKYDITIFYKLLNNFYLTHDETQTGSINLSQSQPGSNSYEEVLQIH